MLNSAFRTETRANTVHLVFPHPNYSPPGEMGSLIVRRERMNWEDMTGLLIQWNQRIVPGRNNISAKLGKERSLTTGTGPWYPLGLSSHPLLALPPGLQLSVRPPGGTIVMCFDVPSGPQGKERKTRSCLVNRSTLRPSRLIHRFLCGTKTTPAEKVFIDWTHAQQAQGGDVGKEFHLCHSEHHLCLRVLDFLH